MIPVHFWFLHVGTEEAHGTGDILVGGRRSTRNCEGYWRGRVPRAVVKVVSRMGGGAYTGPGVRAMSGTEGSSPCAVGTTWSFRTLSRGMAYSINPHLRRLPSVPSLSCDYKRWASYRHSHVYDVGTKPMLLQARVGCHVPSPRDDTVQRTRVVPAPEGMGEGGARRRTSRRAITG